MFFPDIAEFIFEQAVQFSKVPDNALIQAAFVDWIPVEPTSNFESAAYDFCSIVIDRMTTNSIQAFMGSPNGPGPMEKDPASALPLLRRSLEAIESTYVNTDTSRYQVLDSLAAASRLQAYQDKVNKSGQKWLRTGFEPLDELPIYLSTGMLIGLFANTAIGKSWMSIRMAAEMFLQGNKVAVISPEFPVEQLDIRSDVILANLMGYELDHMAITLGLERKGLEEQYKTYLEELGDKGEWINMETTIGGIITLTTITDFVKRERPFFLVVDSILEMDDEEKHKTSWEQMGAKVRGLHSLALSEKMIILVTNQATRGSSGYSGPANLGDVANGYDFARGVDVLLSFGEVEGVASCREVAVPKVRTGQKVMETYRFIFDPNIGDIGRKTPPGFGEGVDNENDFDANVGALRRGSSTD